MILLIITLTSGDVIWNEHWEQHARSLHGLVTSHASVKEIDTSVGYARKIFGNEYACGWENVISTASLADRQGDSWINKQTIGRAISHMETCAEIWRRLIILVVVLQRRCCLHRGYFVLGVGDVYIEDIAHLVQMDINWDAKLQDRRGLSTTDCLEKLWQWC